jgi:hypothetical protein
MSVGNLLRAIATDLHAAPSTRTAPRAVGKHQAAGRALACFHVGEVFLGEQPPAIRQLEGEAIPAGDTVNTIVAIRTADRRRRGTIAGISIWLY